MAATSNANHQHLTLSDRIYIETALERRMKFKDIAVFIEKDPSTVSKEIRLHRSAKRSGTRSALCVHRSTCTKTNMCSQCYNYHSSCGKCTLHRCQLSCPEYEAPVCNRLTHAPYVCNGCNMRSCRQETKYYYRAQIADQEYRSTLSSAREGLNCTALDLDDMDRIISPLLKQGQPLSHIFTTHGEELGCSRRTLYYYLKKGVFSAGPLDLHRMVRYKPRKKKNPEDKPVPRYRSNRTYKDFERFLANNAEANVVEMDTVKGSTSGPVLLTMLFRSCSFMLIFLLKHNTQECVAEVFEGIEAALGSELMQKTFGAILTDNGSEFKNPQLLETSLSGERRTFVFYCDPMASWQKGRLERNHEFIRYILPKGHPFDKLSRQSVVLMMNHINSTTRASLNGRTPFELASLLLPSQLLTWVGASLVPHDDVILNPRLLKNSR